MDLERRTEGLMSEVADLEVRVRQLKVECQSDKAQPHSIPFEGDAKAEVLANLTLAIRHLEDAQARIERAWCRMGTAPNQNHVSAN